MIRSRSLLRADLAITRWTASSGPVRLRISLGAVFLWFGALEFFPGLSPAQDLATRTRRPSRASTSSRTWSC